jgi:hypothetical protein
MSYLDGTAYQGHCRRVLLTGCFLEFSNFLVDVHCLGYKFEVMSRDHGSDGSLSHWRRPLGVTVTGHRASQLIV